jgi:hypothetical protein
MTLSSLALLKVEETWINASIAFPLGIRLKICVISSLLRWTKEESLAKALSWGMTSSSASSAFLSRY